MGDQRSPRTARWTKDSKVIPQRTSTSSRIGSHRWSSPARRCCQRFGGVVVGLAIGDVAAAPPASAAVMTPGAGSTSRNALLPSRYWSHRRRYCSRESSVKSSVCGEDGWDRSSPAWTATPPWFVKIYLLWSLSPPGTPSDHTKTRSDTPGFSSGANAVGCRSFVTAMFTST